MFRKSGQVALIVMTALLLGACNRHKDSAEVARDVDAASQKAARDTANAEQKAGERIASAEKDVAREQRDEQHTAAVQGEKVDKTEAQGRRDIALARCESLSGERQRACKDEANAAYDMEVARSNQERAASDPKQR